MGEYAHLKLGICFSVSPESVLGYFKSLVSLKVCVVQVFVAIEHVPPAPGKIRVSSQAVCDLAPV